LALAIGGTAALTRVPFESDILKLIPQGGPAVQAFQAYVDHFDSLDFVYVLFDAAPGHTISEYEDLVEAYIAELRTVPQIAYVDAALFDSGRDWDYLLDRILLLLGPEGARNALARFQPDSLEAALLRSREALTIPGTSVRELIQRDPLGLALDLRSRFAGNEGFSQFDPAAEGYVSSDGSSRLVIAKPIGPAFDAEFCKVLLDELADVDRRVRVAATSVVHDEDDEVLPPARIEVAGAYRDTLEAESLIRSEMTRNTFVSLALLLAVVFVVFRSYSILLCAATTLGLAGLLAMVVVGLAQGDLLAAASGGAAMVFGLGDDGLMLLYVRFLEERARGASLEVATRRLSQTVSSVFLAFITTVATFAALMLIDFPSLEELGRLVAVGMLLSAGLTLFFVPAFLSFHRSTRPGRSPRLPRLAELVERRSTAILWTAGALTMASLLVLPRLEVIASLEKIQPHTAGSAIEDELEERFELEKNVMLVLARGPELDLVLEKHRTLERELAARGETVSFSSPLAFLPPSSEQTAVSQLIQSGGLTADDVSPRFDEAAKSAGFRPGVFRDFEERLSVLLDPGARITLDGLLEHGLGPLVSRFVVREDTGYLAVTYLHPETEADVSRLAGVVAAIDPSFLVTGQALVNGELRASLLPQFLKGVAIGSIGVILLIYRDFRSVRLTLLCLLPTVLGLLWTAGLLAVAGIELDLFSIFGIVMVIGIGVDYGIHILHRLQSHDGRLGEFLPWTGSAVALAAVTTIIAFGTLAFSSYQPLARLGIMVATSLTFASLASLLVLPALVGERRR
jgi:predicted RND superfamily exporter protein